MRRALLAGLSLGALFAAGAARAQTVITPDVLAGRGLGTTATRSGTVTTIDGGALVGANLFHSFADFSLAAGDTARWARAAGDGASIRNVVSRVTGGRPSEIDGTLDSTALPNAAFFFINPAGVVFGASAQVNVPAAAYFSTAGELRFADGARFSAVAPGGSTLSMAAPESFGFLGGEGAVALKGVSQGFAGATTSLSLVGADVSVADSQLTLAGLDLVAAGPAATGVRLADPLGASLAGAVDVARSQLVVSTGGGVSGPLRIGGGAVSLDASTLVSDTGNGVRGGDLTVSAGQVSLVNGSLLGSSTHGPGAGGQVTLAAGGALSAAGGSIFSISTGAGTGGGLSIDADTIGLSGSISVGSTNNGAGDGGAISLTARTAMSLNTAFVVASTGGSGRSGDVSLSAPTMDLVESLAFAIGSASGKPGDVRLSGDRITAAGGLLGSSPGATTDTGDLTIVATQSFAADGVSMSAATQSDGRAGVISISAPQVTLTNGFIDTDSFGAGGVGKVIIQAGTLSLDNQQIDAEALGEFTDQLGSIELTATGSLSISGGLITSKAFGEARGGAISIQGKDVVLDGALVTADSNGEAAGGRITLTGETIHVSNGHISTDSVNDGPGGDITLSASRSLIIDASATVTSNALGFGDAGAVTLEGGAISVLDGSTVSTAATQGTGNAGPLSIAGDSLTVRGIDTTVLSDTDGPGHAGAVTIHVGSLEVDGQGQPFTGISSDTVGEGDAGDISIEADKISLHDGAFITSASFGDGNAGRVTIKAGAMTIRNGAFVASDSNIGLGHAGDVTITADDLSLQGDGENPTFVSSDAVADGDAGDVRVTAKTLKLDQAFISSSTFLFGEAGDIEVTGGTIVLDHGSTIASAALDGSFGDAGVVKITADSLKVGADSSVTTSTGGSGNAGAVTLKLGSLTVDQGDVSSASVVDGTGASGSLAITADHVSVIGNGRISTLSNNPHPAGQISIVAGDISVSGAGSGIASENQAGNVKFGVAGQSGDAGAIQLTTNTLTVSDGGAISTNSFGGAAGEIDISIKRPGLLILQGALAPGVIQTSSGPGKGGRIVITDPLAIVSNGGSLLALGELRGANVVIQSRYFINSTDRLNTIAVAGDIHLETGLYDVSSGTVVRDLSVLDASKVLRGACPAARSTGAVSQLISRPDGPYVREAAAPAGAPSVAATQACR